VGEAQAMKIVRRITGRARFFRRAFDLMAAKQAATSPATQALGRPGAVFASSNAFENRGEISRKPVRGASEGVGQG
jgi:hypothetical protein